MGGQQADPSGLLADPRYAEREHVAILITDGQPTNFYGDRACVRTGFACAFPARFPNQSVAQSLEAIRATVPQFRLVVIGIGLQDNDRVRLEAMVARPGDLHTVSNMDELRRAIDRTLTSLDSDRKSKVRPLVITPDEGDEVDEQVRQLRVTAYSKLAGDARYGRVDVSAYGCRRQAGGLASGRLKPVASESLDLAVQLARQDRRTTAGNAHRRSNVVGEPGYTI